MDRDFKDMAAYVDGNFSPTTQAAEGSTKKHASPEPHYLPRKALLRAGRLPTAAVTVLYAAHAGHHRACSLGRQSR